MTSSLDIVLLGYQIPDDVLTDLVCRFTSNIPEEEKAELVRVCFQIELAHWFFIDHYCQVGSNLEYLAHIPFNIFTLQMFEQTPYLKQFRSSVDTAITDFRAYKNKVPTYGAILMTKDMSEVLLVQGFRNQWGFPKGKINKDEEEVVCACREVMEETGYDMKKLVNPNHFIESTANDRTAKLYLVVGVERNFAFRPQTSFEIKEISWFGIHELPENKKDTLVQCREGYSNSHFFTVYSYVRRLKRWIADKLVGTNNLTNFRSTGNRGEQIDRTPLHHHHPREMHKQQKHQFQYGQGQGDHSSSSGKSQSQSQNPSWSVTPGQPNPNSQQIVGHSLSQQKPRNPKRRLIFDEKEVVVPVGKELNPFTMNIKTIIPPVHEKEVPRRRSPPQGTSLIKVAPEPLKANVNFFDGPGASAWLNFRLDIGEILKSVKL